MKPMGWIRSIFFFGIPALIMIFLFWIALPMLDKLGKRLFFVFLITIGGAMLMLLLTSLRFARKEGNSSWSSIKSRFRLRPLNRMDWIWAVGVAIIMFVGYPLLSFTSQWVESVIPYQKIFVRMFDPDPNFFMEVKVQGNWFVLLGFLGFALANVFGEEFWWRGYILPRQELSFGSRTWIVHGFLWALFHSFMPWNVIQYIPGALALAYAVQKRANTSIAIVAHFAQNIPVLIQLILGTAGFI